MMCSSVDLPEPDGPTIAVSSPCCDFQRHGVEGAHRRLAGILLDDVDELQAPEARRAVAGAGGTRRRGEAPHDGTTTSVSALRSPSTWTKPLVNRPGLTPTNLVAFVPSGFGAGDHLDGVAALLQGDQRADGYDDRLGHACRHDPQGHGDLDERVDGAGMLSTLIVIVTVGVSPGRRSCSSPRCRRRRPCPVAPFRRGTRRRSWHRAANVSSPIGAVVVTSRDGAVSDMTTLSPGNTVPSATERGAD